MRCLPAGRRRNQRSERTHDAQVESHRRQHPTGTRCGTSHPWIVGRAEAHPAFDVEVLDLRDWPLPFFAENFQTIGDPRDPTYSHPIVKRWNQRIASGDVYLFVTPEYNHSMPAVLKNAIDSVFASFGFRNKAAAS